MTKNGKVFDTMKRIDQNQLETIDFLVQNTNYTRADLLAMHEVEFFQVLNLANSRIEQHNAQFEKAK